MKSQITISMVAAIALAVVASAALAAGGVVGSVVAVRGVVYLESSGAQQPLTIKLPLHEGDSIISAAGKAQIALNDGTIMSVGENSRVLVAEHETAGSDTKSRLRMISGALRLLVAKVTPSGKFEVETETAVAAVRGTDWLIEATPERTSVALVAGEVTVTSRGARPAAVTLDQPGQGTDVPLNGIPTPPTRWGAPRFATLLERASFQ